MKIYFTITTYLCGVTGQLPFIGQVEELLLGAVNIVFRSPDGDLIALAVRAGEFYGDATTVFHNGVDQLSFSTDEGVVEFGRDRDLLADDILELVLDLADLLPGFLHVFPLARDGDDVVLVTLGGKIDFRVGFLSNLANIGAS